MYALVNYGRQEISQTGSGHFACLGGYDPASNKVLVLDTARFKYPPVWVDMEQFYNSINTLDKDAGKLRGFIVASKNWRVEAAAYEDDEYEMGIDLSQILPEDSPKVKFTQDLSSDQLKYILSILNQSEVRTQIFKFVHDLYMVYGVAEGCAHRTPQMCTTHS
mmetsp:Transcript_9167/g.13921  ORF Transcript_9167/g.13921 Transcript_9167/m.13921 type:complete len:163 (+) Transcript_9167:757-1245(+)